MLFSAADAATHFQNIVALNVVHSCYSLSSARIMPKDLVCSFEPLGQGPNRWHEGEWQKEGGHEMYILSHDIQVSSRAYPGLIQGYIQGTSRSGKTQ